MERLAKLEEAQLRKEQAQAKIEYERRAAAAALEAKKLQQRMALENLQREKAEVAHRYERASFSCLSVSCCCLSVSVQLEIMHT